MSQITMTRLDPQQQARAGALGAFALSALESLDLPAIIYDSEFRCVYANAAARGELGLATDAAGSKKWADIAGDPGLHVAARRAAAGGRAEQCLYTSAENGRVWRVHLTPMEEGTAAAVLCPVPSAEAGEPETNRALRHSEWRYRSLIENISEAIVILRADGTIAYVSPSFERVLGYRTETLPRSAHELVHPDDRVATYRSLEEIGTRYGHSKSAEIRVRHRSGEWRTLDVTACNMLHNPAIGGVLVMARDVTETAAARQELRRYVAQLEQTLAQLGRQGNSSTGGNEHLRTPLIGLRGFAELLAGSRLDGPQRDCAERILDAADYLLRLIDASTTRRAAGQ